MRQQLQYNDAAYSALAAYLRGGRLPHAILLEGGPGCGKTTFAHEIAAGALCTASPDQRPCGVCRDCTKVEKGVHPDVLSYSGEGGSRSFHVDTVRQLRQEAYIRAGEGRCKVLVLEDVQHMTAQASNALLKVLEEPPAGVVFVLTCENKAALLDTILSRVSIIHLQTPSPAQCAQALEQLKPELELQRRQYTASQAGGSIGLALSMLEEDGEPSNALSFLLELCTGSELEVLARLGRYEKDKEGFAALLEQLAVETKALLSPNEDTHPDRQTLRRRLSSLQLMKILAIIEEISSAVPQNVNRLLLTTHLCAEIKLALSR